MLGPGRRPPSANIEPAQRLQHNGLLLGVVLGQRVQAGQPIGGRIQAEYPEQGDDLRPAARVVYCAFPR